jgi:hypothetical protein
VTLWYAVAICNGKFSLERKFTQKDDNMCDGIALCVCVKTVKLVK